MWAYAALYGNALFSLKGRGYWLYKGVGEGSSPCQITVNCIAPGVIDTDMNACYSESDIESLCEQIPLGRMGSVRDVAELALFLASKNAAYITGQVIGVDGGFAV